MGESDTVYQELISFLSSPRSDLRKAAAEATLATLSDANNNEAAQRLTSLNAIVPLCKIASVSSSDVGSNDALASILILCSHDLVGNQCILDFIEKGKGIGRMIEIALSSPPTPPSTAQSIAAMKDNDESSNSNSKKLAEEWDEWRKRVNYACALLANACRDERGAVEFIGLSFPEEAIPSSMMKEKSSNEEEKSGAEYEKRDTKPTATLLLSRFLNPSFIDASSDGYKSAMEKFTAQTQSGKRSGPSNPFGLDDEDGIDLDEYNSDLDDAALEEEEEDENQLPSTDSQGLVKITEAEMKTDQYYDPYQHVAAVIMNITQLETGRDFLMKLIHAPKSKKNGAALNSIQEDSALKKETPATSHLQSLLPQLTSPNVTRRQGIAGTLKNCCFSQDSIWWLLNVVNMDKALLMTLAGPEELTIDEKVGLDPDYWLLGPQKVRESNPLVRLYVVEAILLLSASGRRARETLRERRVYVIIKLADMVEENEEVSERLLECVQYLRRDEEGTHEGSSDRRAYEKYARGMLDMDDAKNSNLKALPPSESATGERRGDDDADEDYDNID